MMCGAEAVPEKKGRFEDAEMKILGWMSGVTREDRTEDQRSSDSSGSFEDEARVSYSE
ncbi:hypothetical protein SK128_028468, partial [Halocaridina rubra]